LNIDIAPPFQGFPKIARLARQCTITEKIDGTNGAVVITPGGDIYAQSRNRFVVPGDDNFGFAAWVATNRDQLALLGPGCHFGEWWGAGIGRKYGLAEKRFSLFNTHRWNTATPPPACCSVVPVLYEGEFSTIAVSLEVERLMRAGSVAAPGWHAPEGVMVYHHAAGIYFKKTLHNDEAPKGKAA
jgi:hypothetical protein